MSPTFASSTLTGGRGIARRVETMIRGELRIAVRHECRLGRARAAHEFQVTRIAPARGSERVAFEVVLDVAEDRADARDIADRDVALVRARMHGDALAAGLDRDPCGDDRIRQAAAA